MLGPNRLKQELWGIWFLLGPLWFGIWSVPEGLGLHFCVDFTFSQDAHFSRGWLGVIKVTPHHWTDPVHSQVCIGWHETHELAMTAFTLVRGGAGVWTGSFPSKCLHFHCLVGNRNKMGYRAGGHAGWGWAGEALAGWPEPQGVSICCLHVTRSKSVCIFFK